MSDIDSIYPEFLEAYSAFKFGDGDVPSQELVYECLMYSFLSGEPLPRELTSLLIREFEVIRSGINSPLFKKPKSRAGETKTPTTHPEARYIELRAVAYVKTNRKTGWDKSPVKTICDVFGIGRTTYYRWQKKYPKARDDYTKEGMNYLLEQLAPKYLLKKYS